MSVVTPRAASEVVGSLHLGDHVCAIYEAEEQLAQLAGAYLRRGLEQGERCILIRDQCQDVHAELARMGADVDEAVARGQLLFVTQKETYLRDGDFQPEAMLDVLRGEDVVGGTSALPRGEEMAGRYTDTKDMTRIQRVYQRYAPIIGWR